ncbi:Nuclear poly(A) polymerase 1 [Zea mays]|uniref:Nuclear poly(A) polymerase 1 n=1 Tax=Zea mays TaxID=4577 RepID=A0A1D6NLA1_MAIZE|nr:Nuclear poly(A) polymerase 1 [Zea mays]
MSKVKNNNGYHGVTEPISLSGPTEKYLMQTAEVEKTVKAWIKKATRISRYGEQFVHEANAKIFTFGSYRLRVHGPGADIDTLCVGPRHATRNEYFFRWLHDILAEMPEVSELHPVPDAHVPVLGFKINGVSIDLLYANLAHAVIPEVSLSYCTAV